MKWRDLGDLGRRFHLGFAGGRAAVADVVGDGVVEQHGVLRNHADHRSQALLGDRPDVLAVDW